MLAEGIDRHQLLRDVAQRLPGDTPRLDAELLMAHALGVGRLQMLMGREPLATQVVEAFQAMVARRLTHEPVAHILGEREFWSLTLKVTADTLVPRPDSETLIEQALEWFKGRAPDRILDLGTGSGALLLSALSEWPQARGIGIDKSPKAVAVARQNAVATGLVDRADIREGDWLEGLDGQKFDLILCNPPYIPDSDVLMPDVALFEPHSALFGGADGLEPYRLLIPQIRNYMQDHGVALFEFGVGQSEALVALGQENGFQTQIIADLAGMPRVLRLI